QPLRRVIFMDHAGGHLPDIQVFLSHAQQHRDILRLHHMALAEPGVLILSPNNLGQVVTQHMAHGLLGTDQLHPLSSSEMMVTWSPGRTVPFRTTTAKMPSVGITQVPVALRMAQSLWHSLPIWVTSTSVSPICRWVPTGRFFRSMPRVLIFSANTPGSRVGSRGRSLSTLSSARRLIC